MPDESVNSIDSVSTTDSVPTTDQVPTTDDVAEASDTDVTVTSDDGVLEVFVPAGSGPADVTIEQIDIPDAGVPAVGYELGPDGATYSEPVTLTFSLPADEWSPGEGVPVVVFASDSDDVPIPTTSRDGDIVTVVAEVDHFSEFYSFGTNRAVEIQPTDIVLQLGLSALAEVWVVGDGRVEIGATRALWSAPPGFSSLPGDTSSKSESETGSITGAIVTCDVAGADGLLNVELELSSFGREDASTRAIVEAFFGPLISALITESTSNVKLETTVSCVEPIEPIQQDCLNSGGEIVPPEEDIYCVVPESVLPGADPYSLNVEFPEVGEATNVIVSLSGGEDPATEILIRYPSDRAPFAFFSNSFQELSFIDPLFVLTIVTEKGFELSDLPITVNDSGTTLLDVPAGVTSDGTEVPATEVPLTGVTIEIGNMGATTTSAYDPQRIWFWP